MIMHESAFAQRERALENEFFYRVDKELLEGMRKTYSDQAAKKALAAASGFTDESLLDELLELKIAPETLGALSLVPLVLVAWADRAVDLKERRAVLQAAIEDGIASDGAAYRLLEYWLENEPPPELGQTWAHFIRTVLPLLTDDMKWAFREEIMKQARRAAKASRPGLGMKKISHEEAHILHELERAFSSA